MKKKIFIAMATFFFAAIAFYNVQVTQHNGDISLEHVALMAQANGESGGSSPCVNDTRILFCAGGDACTHIQDPYWTTQCKNS